MMPFIGMLVLAGISFWAILFWAFFILLKAYRLIQWIIRYAR